MNVQKGINSLLITASILGGSIGKSIGGNNEPEGPKGEENSNLSEIVKKANYDRNSKLMEQNGGPLINKQKNIYGSIRGSGATKGVINYDKAMQSFKELGLQQVAQKERFKTVKSSLVDQYGKPLTYQVKV